MTDTADTYAPLQPQGRHLAGLDLNAAFIFCATAAVFLVHPLGACLLCVVATFISNNRKGVAISLLFLWLMVVLIQSHRELKPVIDYYGDWGRYGDSYLQSADLSFFRTEKGSKDIGFTAWNHLCTYIFGKHYLAYADFTLDVEMLLFALGSYRVWRASGRDARVGVCAVCMVLLFSEIILITNNLLRQMFATSIILYGLVLKNTSRSRAWILFLVWGFLTHSMTALFIPLYFLPVARRLDRKQLLWTVAGCGALVAFLILAKGLLMSSTFYILQRIGSADEYTKDDVINPIVVYKFAVVVFFIYFKHYFIDREKNRYIWLGSNALLYITLVCIVTADMPLLVTRIYIDRLPLLSMFIPYFFARPSMLNKVYLFMVCMFYFMRFALFSHGDYIDLSSYALQPFLSLL